MAWTFFGSNNSINSDTRYQTPHIRGAPSCRMRATGAPRISGDGIPLLRYLHMVRINQPKAGGSNFIALPFRSQTSWVWLEAKLVELEMVGSDKNYKASRVTEKLFIASDALVDLVWYVSDKLGELPLAHPSRPVLDKTAMFTVFSTRDGKQYTHSVKPLQIIWNHLKQ
jgi:hypothetical protein